VLLPAVFKLVNVNVFFMEDYLGNRQVALVEARAAGVNYDSKKIRTAIQCIKLAIKS